jgi:predicted XRE-type DNA-binding protein
MGGKLARFTIDRLVTALQSLDPEARVTAAIGVEAAGVEA